MGGGEVGVTADIYWSSSLWVGGWAWVPLSAFVVDGLGLDVLSLEYMIEPTVVIR